MSGKRATGQRARVAAFLFVVGLLFVPRSGSAAPRDDLMNAYIEAANQLNELQLDAALVTLDAAVQAAADAGITDHPVLANVHAMRAGIIFATSNGDKGRTLAACIEAVKIDYYVQLPIELRSSELTQICEEARSGVQAPSEPITHTPPPGTPKSDIEFSAIVNAPVPEGGQVVLYWRSAGTDAEFAGLEMNVFGNYAYWTILADEHGGKDIEYFFYAFDPTQRVIANLGDKTRPMVLKMDANAVAPTDGGTKDGKKAAKGKKGAKGKRKSGLPRVFINFGFGTGAGIARGSAEITYEQYTPGLPNSIYGTREQACAVERWFAAGADLAPDQLTFDQNLRTIQSAGATILPFDASNDNEFANFVAAYDPAYCSRKHPVSTGFALAPFHVTPEVGVRVGRAVVISLFSRLQVVTGSKVFTDDPNKQLTQSFNLDVRSPQPAGFRQKPPFSFTVGAKVKYFFGKDDRKFRLFLGGFVGYGFARLRVPMNFANDRNGNSVPDSVEAALHGPLNADGQVDPDQCTVVWPYNAGCTMSAEGDADRNLATGVRAATPTTDERVDTVVIGPGFLGAAFGFHYQVVKYFGLFAELDVGVWFPNTSSALFDLTFGPSLTF